MERVLCVAALDNNLRQLVMAALRISNFTFCFCVSYDLRRNSGGFLKQH
jgi:hypothetical protein